MNLTPALFSGVVDSSLKVYGTVNLRVVDASMFPIQIGAHPQATVYAIAEKVNQFHTFHFILFTLSTQAAELILSASG